MKQKIIDQICKSLGFNEDRDMNEFHLARFLGLTFDFLQNSKKQKGWVKKEKRIYRLNQIICILKNKGIKSPNDIKNTLENERFKFSGMDEDSSYINIINSLVPMDEFINYLILELKLDFICSKLQITKSLLGGLIGCPVSGLQKHRLKVDIFYSFIKKVFIKNKEVHLSILLEPFKCLENNTPMFFILEEKWLWLEKTVDIIYEFYQEKEV